MKQKHPLHEIGSSSQTQKEKDAENLPEPESNKKDPHWGKYALASDRSDVPHEPNTDFEEKVEDALRLHYKDDAKLPGEIAGEIQSLIDDHEYLKLLRFPSEKYHVVYRGMRVGESTLRNYVNLDQIDQESTEEWQVVKASGIAKPKAETASWSITIRIAKIFAQGAEMRDKPDEPQYAIILEANTQDNPDTFIMNPDNIYNVQSLSPYKREKEAIAVGPVKFNKIHFMKA